MPEETGDIVRELRPDRSIKILKIL